MDYVTGTITVNGKVVSTLEGSYCSAIRIDGKKYYDWRYCKPYRLIIKKSSLPSDWALRRDVKPLNHGDSFLFNMNYSCVGDIKNA